MRPVTSWPMTGTPVAGALPTSAAVCSRRLAIRPLAPHWFKGFWRD
jgi:hypothetical protein